jgi:hypothetical protein
MHTEIHSLGCPRQQQPCAQTVLWPVLMSAQHTTVLVRLCLTPFTVCAESALLTVLWPVLMSAKHTIVLVCLCLTPRAVWLFLQTVLWPVLMPSARCN